MYVTVSEDIYVLFVSVFYTHRAIFKSETNDRTLISQPYMPKSCHWSENHSGAPPLTQVKKGKGRKEKKRKEKKRNEKKRKEKKRKEKRDRRPGAYV